MLPNSYISIGFRSLRVLLVHVGVTFQTREPRMTRAFDVKPDLQLTQKAGY